MSSAPSFTLDVETATTFRDWLFETGVENHAKPQIADPLAELAAAIDGELHDSTEYVAISASMTAFPSTDRSAGVDESGSPTRQESETSTQPVDDIPIDDADSDSPRLDDCLLDDAWHNLLDQQNADQASTPTAHCRSTSSTPIPYAQDEGDRVPVRYLIAYECSVCGSIRELETSLQVCAFVDDCAACGAVDTRFTAVGIPEPVNDFT